MRTNRRAASCERCATWVAVDAGLLDRKSGRWVVYCTTEHQAEDATAPPAPPVPGGAPPPAEVRITGTPAQVQAITEALSLTTWLRTGERTGPYTRRDEPDRVAVYAPVDVAAGWLAGAEREHEEMR